MTKAIGEDAALLIGREFMGGNFKVPVGRPFLIRYLFSKGMKQQQIARTLHVDVSTIPRKLSGLHPDDEEDNPKRSKRGI